MKRSKAAPVFANYAPTDLVRSGLNLIAQAVSIYDDDLRLVVANEQCRAMFDLPEELVTRGASFHDTVLLLAERGEYGPGDPRDLAQERVDLARAFEPHYFERTRPGGQTISVEGHPLAQGGWVAVYTDITDFSRRQRLLEARTDDLSAELAARNAELERTSRRQASLMSELRESRRAHIASEARLKQMIAATPGHISYLDRDGVYRYSNRRFSNVLMSVEDPVGRRFDEAQAPDVKREVAPIVERALGGETVSHGYRIGADADRETSRAMRTTVTPEVGPDGAVAGVFAFTQDVTEQERAAEALARSQSLYAAAAATSGLAHDFSNLLTIILGLQGRLAAMEDLPAGAPDLIEATKAAAVRGGALIRNLAELSEEDALEEVPTDVAALLSRIAGGVEPVVAKGTLAVEGPEGPVWALVDAGRFGDAVLNLLMNAKDAADAAAPQIRIVWRADADGLRVAVEDNGAGFARDAAQRAFEPFYSTKGETGRGLGLSRTLQFAEAAGGDVAIARSALGGAKVELSLPYRPCRPTNGAEAPDRSPEGIALVVDDDDDIRAAVRDMMREIGWPVVEAAGAAEAIALATSVAEIKLVLSDLVMSDGDGGLALGAALGNARPDLTLRIMTGLPPDAPERRQAASIHPVIAKPFDAEALGRFLSEAP